METTTKPAQLDADSRAWLNALRASGSERQHAVERLHALLLRAARFEVSRRAGSLGGDADEVALEAADDALMSVLRRLDDFRGASRFTTWAYKFALLEAAVKVRRRQWRGREIALEPERWEALRDAGRTPDEAAGGSELLAAVVRAIDGALTAHQRQVLTALAFDAVPIDVLAQRLGTTRGALYKTLHDARRKLRAELAAQGLSPEEVT